MTELILLTANVAQELSEVEKLQLLLTLVGGVFTLLLLPLLWVIAKRAFSKLDTIDEKASQNQTAIAGIKGRLGNGLSAEIRSTTRSVEDLQRQVSALDHHVHNGVTSQVSRIGSLEEMISSLGRELREHMASEETRIMEQVKRLLEATMRRWSEKGRS